ncbi:hypothetical protein [Gracilibacillus lacisalsi]|uniref:hypothetical protein n=1 Tax=Gracilibacillus lacisalsi TaxID=393087 RepID=UPI000364ECF9|nr:hypothetical protein [Gracilibacillus lacisalsi]
MPKELDPSLITVMISSLTIYPLLYSKVTSMITGFEPDDPEFQHKWSQFLLRCPFSTYTKQMVR